MDLLHPAIERYVHGLLPARDPVLQAMERLAEERQFPAVGPLVGRFLAQLARMTGARRVLELGSGFGYSAYWWLAGMGDDGQVILTDGSREHAKLAGQFFAQAGLAQRIQFEVGDALQTLDRLDGPFDIIFMDIDKAAYPDAFRQALPKLKTGGLFVADNVLWFGSVTSARDKSPETEAIRAFTKLAYGPGLNTTIIPLRDGVSVTVKERSHPL